MKIQRGGILTLNVPWGHIAAKTWGDPKNRPVLVVHGILDNAGAFDRLIALLPQNFYYVCIDLPGHGLSAHFQPGTPLNYTTYLLVIRYVLDELQWKQAYYMGHSFGGHLGLLFTLIYPDKIQKLILIDGIVPRPSSDEEIIPRILDEHNQAIEGYRLARPRYYTKEEVLYGLRSLRKSCLTSEAAKAIFERSVIKVGENSYCYNRDYRAKITIIPNFSKDQTFYLLRQIKVETLIVIVTDTLPFLEKIKPDILDILKNFSFVNIVEVNGNHDIHNNYPEKISNYISQFLNHIPSKL